MSPSLRAPLVLACLVLPYTQAFLAPFPASSKPLAVCLASRNQDGLTDRRDLLKDWVLGSSALALAFAGSRAASAKESLKYLKEPTDEFKAQEAEQAAFDKKARDQKKEWKDIFSKYMVADSEDKVVDSVHGLTKLVVKFKGLPEGVKKQPLITEMRKVKRAGKEKGFWTKDAEIAYEELINTINFMQSPNTNRDSLSL